MSELIVVWLCLYLIFIQSSWCINKIRLTEALLTEFSGELKSNL